MEFILSKSKSTYLLLLLLYAHSWSHAFTPSSFHKTFLPRSPSVTFLTTANTSPFVTSHNNNLANSYTICYMGYQFGDISKGLAKKFTNAVNKTTGKDHYEFGDLTKYLDKQAKQKAAALAGKKKGEDYEFGDLTRWVDSKVKDGVAHYAGKDKSKGEQYEFGDLTKTILKKVWSGEYSLQDIMTLCKLLTSFGVGLSPVAGWFPTKFLIEFLNFSIAQDVGGKIIGSLTQEVDRRVKKAVIGDENYQMGDFTKKQILKYINKDEYSFGDITKTILADYEDGSIKKGGSGPKSFLTDLPSSDSTSDSTSSGINPEILKDLEKWDKALDLNLNSLRDTDKKDKAL